MKTSNAVVWLSSLIVALALVAAGIGLFWPGGGSPFSFTTLRGETVMDRQALPAHFSVHLPRRGIAGYLFAVGLALIVVWLGLSILPPLLQGGVPQELAGFTTLVTHALDLGIIAPVAFLAGVLLLRRDGLGYLLASTLLVLSWTIGTGILAATVAQVLAGALTAGQLAAFAAPFVILTLVGIWLTVVLFRHSSDTASPAPASGVGSAPRRRRVRVASASRV